MAWHGWGVVWHDMVGKMVWHGRGMAWHGWGMVWHGMVGVWYGMV